MLFFKENKTNLDHDSEHGKSVGFVDGFPDGSVLGVEVDKVEFGERLLVVESVLAATR